MNDIIFSHQDFIEIREKLLILVVDIIHEVANKPYVADMHMRDYFSLYEIVVLCFGLNPFVFELCDRTKNIYPNGITDIIKKWEYSLDYVQGVEHFNAKHEMKLFSGGVFSKNLIFKMNNFRKLIYSAISHGDIPFNNEKYNDYLKNNREYEIEIHRDDVKEFLIKKNIKSEFFGTTEIIQANSLPSYLNPESPYYAPLLSCAIKLHEIFSSQPELCPSNNQIDKFLGKKMTEWLEKPENANLIGLDKKYRNDNARKLVITIAKWYQKEEEKPKKPKKQKVTPQ